MLAEDSPKGLSTNALLSISGVT